MSYESDQPDDGAAVGYWLNKLQRAQDALKEWRDAAEKAESDYFDDRKDGKRQLFNVFYSTVNTLQARLYSKDPVPDIRRRFDMPGPEGAAAKAAAMMLERAISYTLDTSDFTPDAQRAVQDFLIAGCGVPWVEYDAKVSEGPEGLP